MKKIFIPLTTFLLFFLFSSITSAGIRTIYPSSEPEIIYTRVGTQSYIVFQTAIMTASVGNNNLFNAQTDNLVNKVQITPKVKGAFTNLIVFAADGTQYEFYLQEGDKFDGIVNVKSSINIQIQDLINITNKRKVEIDPVIKKLTRFYEITHDTFGEKDGLKFYLKRAVTVDKDNKTIYWIRLVNDSLSIYHFPDETQKKEKELLQIPLSSFSIEDRSTVWIVAEENRQQLLPGEICDLYFILEGNWTDPSLQINFNLNGKDTSTIIMNIPYSRQEFKVFHAEDNIYTTIKIEDYWR